MKRRTALLLLALSAAAAPPAAAQERCAPAPVPAGSWDAPLDRPVSVHAGMLPLADALERITTAARLRLSYSRDLLPALRRTCVEFDGAAVGAILTHILRDTGLRPVVASADHVVLAPGRAPNESRPALPEPVIVLDRINVAAAASRPTAAAGSSVAVVEGAALEQSGARTLAAALDGAVPGLWLWPQGAGAPVAQYGSLRGTSSFGATAPKLYIDGLELANPLLAASLDPATIERVEVLRGPQAAALFGADAAAGVLHITTRHGTLDGSGARLLARTGVGMANSAFVRAAALEQEHGLSAYTGTPARSARLDLSFSSLGEYVPAADWRTFSAVASARAVGARSTVTVSLRLLSERTAVLESPLLQPAAPAADRRDLAVDQYTGGITAAFRPGARWSHTAVAGVTGYGVSGDALQGQGLTPADSVLLAAGDHAFRTTLRLTSARGVPLGRRGTGSLTFGAEHSQLYQTGGLSLLPFQEQEPPALGGGSGRMAGAGAMSTSAFAAADDALRQRGNLGLSTRLDAKLYERLELTAGLRWERITFEGARHAAALLPGAGAALSALRGPISLTLRAGYGAAVRWPELPQVGGIFRPIVLAPERQAGTEFGIDLALGQRLRLQATRFDQLATGLVQTVSAPADTARMHGTRAGMTLPRYDNAGSIANQGWEFGGQLSHLSLTLSGTLSLVDSRVRAVAERYDGDLAVGDRALAVPAATMSLAAAWLRPGWSASLGVSRASDWINYDRLALAADRTLEPEGAALRRYWKQYDGVTRLRASVSRELGARFTVRLSGENLLDVQTGEPDNTTVVPGRTMSLGLRARF